MADEKQIETDVTTAQTPNEEPADRGDEPAKEPAELGTLQAELAREREQRLVLEANQNKLERMIAASNKALEELKTESGSNTLETLEAKKKDLVDRIVQAHENSDVRGDLELRDQLYDLNEEIRLAKQPKPKAAPPPEQDVLQNPDYRKWLGDNPWFGSDTAMSGAAISLMNELNVSGKAAGMSPKERFEYVGNEVKKRFGMTTNTRRMAPGKVEGARGDDRRMSGSGQGFEDLPADAKAQCDKFAQRFVGKRDAEGNVKYKSIGEYRAHYAQDYFDDSWGTKQLTRYQ